LVYTVPEEVGRKADLNMMPEIKQVAHNVESDIMTTRGPASEVREDRKT